MPPVKKILSDVTLQLQRHEAFLLRVVRKWMVPYDDAQRGNKSMELVLVDEKEVRIQASISRTEIQLFESQLEEGGLYAMCNFTVKANNGKWRPASHPFRLQFHEGTKVKCQELKDHKDFPLHIYNFTSFNDIHNCPDGKSTTDLIGKSLVI
ncbi:unnamed protein product [Cuscuta europaea]|uniref:Replication protein A 70 kDa DNA-binding subunit B/D first OB fold domain-containing protein n=1 Tax=Cuscuta europaea TaxID=41803 RepID=A0A9P1EN30_CUSEU|nr:unnamed protein product [Cuscuta europaea]